MDNSEPRFLVPAKSLFATPTEDEARSLLAELRELYPYRDLFKSGLIGYSLFGSAIYNLDTPESDRDLFLLVAGKASKDFQLVDAAGRDVRVASVHSFAKEYFAGSHFAVDMVHSNSFQVTDSTGWQAFVGGLRFRSYDYVHGLEHLVEVFSSGAEKKVDEERRSLKFLKTALRNQVLVNRYRREERIRPRFSENERSDFYGAFETIKARRAENELQALVEALANTIS